MADLIDRQAALDAISTWRRDYPLDLQEPFELNFCPSCGADMRKDEEHDE